MYSIPDKIGNLIAGEERDSISGYVFDNIDPATGEVIGSVARSTKQDIELAVQRAKIAQIEWANIPAVKRGLILHQIVIKMIEQRKDIAKVVARETGKSFQDAFGEVGGAIECGLFFASEGQRLYGKTTTSGTPNKYASTIRQPIGVAGLIIAANTPIANVAWKVFPALICGNSAVLKPAEDAPATAWIFGKLATEAGLPEGVLNIVHGYGEEAGASLVQHQDIGVISFTGSTCVGRYIQHLASDRMARVSLELGGKNALVVCDDADLDNAVNWILLSAFSNAGQRCAAASRVIIFKSIYEMLKTKLVEETTKLRIGTGDGDDLGPVINQKQLNNMLEQVQKAEARGATVLAGGSRFTDKGYQKGCYMAPTLIEGVNPDDEIAQTELFGPIAILFQVVDYQEALSLTNESSYGLTASIHTSSIHRANHFIQNARTGVVVVNAGTYGSEPHMPFGGYGYSGNGTREPGTEALDVYSELKDVYLNIDPEKI